jgi:hypothetical protein
VVIGKPKRRGQMGIPERRSLIKEIEDLTKSRLIIYITGDRRGLETRIANDVQPLIHEHLRGVGVVPKLNLFLYTAGGDALAGWGIVSLLREFCKSLGVIIPYRALSCGTLISLGADEVIMAKGAQLSPVDPSLASPYNPPAPGQMQPGAVQLLPVSVEDVMGYLKLAREEVGITGDEGLTKIVGFLSERIHPLALGAVYRSREQIALLAHKLLASHEKDKTKIDRMVDTLTKELPSHQYVIPREEAKNLGFPIADPPEPLEELIWKLHKEYESWLELNKPYNPEELLGANPSTVVGFDRAAIESLKPNAELKTHVFRTEREISRVQGTQPGVPFPVVGIQERNTTERWIEI